MCSQLNLRVQAFICDAIWVDNTQGVVQGQTILVPLCSQSPTHATPRIAHWISQGNPTGPLHRTIASACFAFLHSPKRFCFCFLSTHGLFIRFCATLKFTQTQLSWMQDENAYTVRVTSPALACLPTLGRGLYRNSLAIKTVDSRDKNKDIISK